MMIVNGTTSGFDIRNYPAIIMSIRYIKHATYCGGPKDSDPIAVSRQMDHIVAKMQRNSQKRELAGRHVW